jgi:hypothetical protein
MPKTERQANECKKEVPLVMDNVFATVVVQCLGLTTVTMVK